MQNDAALSVLSRDELEQLVSIYAKNWLAMDGYWFQAVERKRGMDEAMEHDVAVWQGFTRTEARRIRALLRLPEQAGLDGLEKRLPTECTPASTGTRSSAKAMMRSSTARSNAMCSAPARKKACRTTPARRSALWNMPALPKRSTRASAAPA